MNNKKRKIYKAEFSGKTFNKLSASSKSIEENDWFEFVIVNHKGISKQFRIAKIIKRSDYRAGGGVYVLIAL